jgi:D-alanine-D-alanine ligase
MILTPQGPVFLEINTLPGLTKASFIPQQLAAAGKDLKAFLVQQLELARRRYD